MDDMLFRVHQTNTDTIPERHVEVCAYMCCKVSSEEIGCKSPIIYMQMKSIHTLHLAPTEHHLIDVHTSVIPHDSLFAPVCALVHTQTAERRKHTQTQMKASNPNQ